MDVTSLITKTSLGDKVSEEALFALTYNKFKEIAQSAQSKTNGNQPLDIVASTTALVHDAYLKLHPSLLGDINNRREFFSLVSKTMRHILIDHYRKTNTKKRTSQFDHTSSREEQTSTFDYIQIDNAICKLSKDYPRQAQVLQFKYFLGFINKEIAALVNVSESTVDKDLLFSKKWLRANAA